MTTIAVRLRRLTRMEREVTRHTYASVIATVVTYAVLAVVVVAVSDADAVERTTSATMSLLFGIYGPSFLVLSHMAFRRYHGDRLRTLLRQTDERRRWVRWFLLAGPKSWAMLVVMAGLVAVVSLAVQGAEQSAWLVAVCVVGVVGTWVVMVGVFAVEYMRLWANEDAIVFPGDEDRAFGDFVYLAVQMSTTFSSADVQFVRRSARNLAVVHAVSAFAYSTAIIAVFASLLIANG